MFFCKERKRKQRTTRSFIKNVKECNDHPLFYKERKPTVKECKERSVLFIKNAKEC